MVATHITTTKLWPTHVSPACRVEAPSGARGTWTLPGLYLRRGRHLLLRHLDLLIEVGEEHNHPHRKDATVPVSAVKT